MAKAKLNFISSWDDGRIEDIELAALLKKYGLPAIFFIPSNCQLDTEEISELAKSFVIGGHTQSHPTDIKTLSLIDQIEEILPNRSWLMKLTGQKVEWFCYPRGRFDLNTIKAVKTAGFKFARTTLVGGVDWPEDNLKIKTSVHVFQRDEYKGVDWMEYAKNRCIEASKKNGVFHLWGHSWEVEKFNQWEKLESFFKWVVGNFDIKLIHKKTAMEEEKTPVEAGAEETADQEVASAVEQEADAPGAEAEEPAAEGEV